MLFYFISLSATTRGPTSVVWVGTIDNATDETTPHTPRRVRNVPEMNNAFLFATIIIAVIGLSCQRYCKPHVHVLFIYYYFFDVCVR